MSEYNFYVICEKSDFGLFHLNNLKTTKDCIIIYQIGSCRIPDIMCYNIDKA